MAWFICIYALHFCALKREVDYVHLNVRATKERGLMRARKSWQAYWDQGAASSLLGGRPSAVQGFISRYFLSRVEQSHSVLDIATGKGDLIRQLRPGAVSRRVGMDYVDLSSLAWDLSLARIDENNEGVGGKVSDKGAVGRIEFYGKMDAASLDFEAASFDVVVSQFGIEYAELEKALLEVERVLKPQAQVMFICHRADTALIQQARRQLKEAKLVQKQALFANLWTLLNLGEIPFVLSAEANESQLIFRDSGEQEAEFFQLEKQLLNDQCLPKQVAVIPAALELCHYVLSRRNSFLPQQQRDQIQYAHAGLESNIARLEHQCRAALDSTKRNLMTSFFSAAGFKVKTKLLKEAGKPLAFGMYFSRGF